MAGNHLRFFGVDFSGASEPGTSIWMTECIWDGGTLRVKRCDSASERFTLPRSADRSRVYRHIIGLIENNPNAVFGFDFPFSLPRQILRVDSWRRYLEIMPDRFEVGTPDGFREDCTARAERETSPTVSHLRRETDFRYAAQCPYQAQIQYQTLYGQSEFLRPLIEEDKARVVPMQDTTPGLPILVEVYPAATLGVLRLYRSGYKNHGESPNRRTQMVNELGLLGFELPPDLTERCIDSDDALDSVICAIAAYHAYSNDFRAVEETAEIEGQIFA